MTIVVMDKCTKCLFEMAKDTISTHECPPHNKKCRYKGAFELHKQNPNLKLALPAYVIERFIEREEMCICDDSKEEGADEKHSI